MATGVPHKLEGVVEALRDIDLIRIDVLEEPTH